MYGDKMKRVAILGGSFNPMHSGHAAMLNAARDVLKPDELWLMPAKKPPHKPSYEYVDDADRLLMLKAYAEDYEDVFVNDTELSMEGFTYTANTMQLLKEKYPDNSYIFLIGADSAANFHNWFRPDIIIGNAELGIFARNDTGISELEKIVEELKTKLGGNYHIIDFTPVDVSSTEIRELVKEGKSIEGLVPEKVRKYIVDKGLYRTNNNEYDNAFLLKEMEKSLKPSRYSHTLGVRDTAVRLAEIYGADVKKAETAAILHDCAKNLGAEQLVNLCDQNGIEVLDDERNDHNIAEALLHSKVGALLAKNLYNIEDREILDAIYYHTVGRPEMGLLEKIVYVADFIEPGRTQNCSPGLDFLRKLADTDIDKVVYYATKATIDYITGKGRYVNSCSLKTLEYYSRYKGDI